MQIVANGHRYDVRDNGYIYLDFKRVSKAQMMSDLEADIRPTTRHNDTDELAKLERVEANTIKGPTMNYQDKVEHFGIERAALERKVGRTAYKPDSEYQGKHYSGSYLCNIKGTAKVISELTYQGNLQIFPVNYKTLGFYMQDLYNIAKTKELSSFNSIRPGSISLDDLGTIEDPQQIVDTISVIRVEWADLDLVTFLNETTGQFMGTKRYSIYQAEQEARLKKPDMDTIFDQLQEQDIKEMEAERGEDREEVA